MTECTQARFGFHEQKTIEVKFNAGASSSDGGALLLRQLDEKLGLTKRFSALVPDRREPILVVHDRTEQLRQRVYQICLGYEDCNDAKTLREDMILRLACGGSMEEGAALSSQPTLSRLENAVTMQDIRPMLLQMESEYVNSFESAPEFIILDVDTTEDKTHGQQQLSFFNGYYESHMYHPFMVFDALSGQLITSVLRAGNSAGARGVMGVLRRIIVGLKAKYPDVKIVVRGDSAFSMPRLMLMLESLNKTLGHIDYLFGLAGNKVLQKMALPLKKQALQRFEITGKKARLFESHLYAAETWPQQRHVVFKAEQNDEGDNLRCVVTSFHELPARWVYEAYCGRGQCENFIKDFKNALYADRLSCSTFAANFFRLLLHGCAYNLMLALRKNLAAVEPKLATAQMDSIRLKLLKVAATVKISHRKISIRMPSVFPLAATFAALATALQL